MFKDPSGACKNEFFYVMKEDKPSLIGGEYLCGNGNIVRNSLFNTMILAYTSDTYNTGRFSCQISLNCDCGWSIDVSTSSDISLFLLLFYFMFRINLQ